MADVLRPQWFAVLVGVARRPRVDRGEGLDPAARPRRHRPRHRHRRQPRAARRGRSSSPSSASSRARSPACAAGGRSGVARGRRRPCATAVRPPPASALRVPRPGPDREPHEPGQHRPQPDPAVPGDDPADDVERASRSLAVTVILLIDRPRPHAAGARQPPAAQRVRASASASGSTRPSWASSASRPTSPRSSRRRCQRRAGGQGLRRRAGAGKPASTPRPTSVYDAVDRGRRGCEPCSCRRSSMLPNIGLILVLAYGGHQVINGSLTLGSARRVQRLRRHADLAAAHARHDPRPGAASRRVEPAGRTRSSSPTRDRRRAARRRAAGRRAGRPAGELRFEAVDVRLPGGRDAARCSTGSTSSCAPGESVALVGADRLRQDDRGPADPALLRRRRRPHHARRRRRPRASLHELRHAVGIVFEDTFLFNDTVAANIAFAEPDASHERSSGPLGWRARTTSSSSCPRATTPRSASAGSRCPAGSASASPSRARSSPTRGC